MTRHRHLWIFKVTKGESFLIRPRGNPVMRHDGTLSVLQCLCTDEEAEVLEKQMKAFKTTVEKHSPREEEEQRQERNDVFSVLAQEMVWPTPACPECAWFDASIDGYCGAGMVKSEGYSGWDSRVAATARQNPKFVEDYEKCPLKKSEPN